MKQQLYKEEKARCKRSQGKLTMITCPGCHVSTSKDPNLFFFMIHFNDKGLLDSLLYCRRCGALLITDDHIEGKVRALTSSESIALL